MSVQLFPSQPRRPRTVSPIPHLNTGAVIMGQNPGTEKCRPRGRIKACYHSSSEAKQRTRVFAVSPSSPVSRTPGMKSDFPRSDVLPRYYGSPPRSPSRGDADLISEVHFVRSNCSLLRFRGYFLPDTKCDLKPSRLHRCLGNLVHLEYHLVPGPGRQAPETSRCHPSLAIGAVWYKCRGGEFLGGCGGTPSQVFTPTHQL